MNNIGQQTEDKLLELEKTLEEIGRSICKTNGGMATWTDINRGLDCIRNAIRNCYLMD